MRYFNFCGNALQRFEKVKKKKFFRYGLPFLLFLFLGSFGLERFASLRYEFRKNTTLTTENLEKLGIKKKKIDLEEEYEEYKKLDIDNWENIRGPRPWEEPQTQNKKS